MHRPLRTTWVICAVFCATVFRLSAGLAQTVDPITPSGLNTQINLSATPPAGTVQYDITGGTRSGTNLFHSFGEFGVPNNNIANFLNDTGSATSNILGRVTGGNVSSIFGTIQTTGFGNANLFLMNPAGIVFCTRSPPATSLRRCSCAMIRAAASIDSSESARSPNCSQPQSKCPAPP